MNLDLGPCPSFTHPDCPSPTVRAWTELPAEWGTGRPVLGRGGSPRDEAGRLAPGIFTATTIAECGAGHRVAGGHRAKFARVLAGEV